MSGSGSAKHRQSKARFARLRPRTVYGRAGLALALVALGQAVLLPGTAEAATNLTVTTTADISASAGACGNASITTPPSPLSLREATCLANNIGGAVTINVPAGHYYLPNGELQPGLHSGQNVTIAGAGSASTIVDAQHVGRVFNIDWNSVGGVTASISGLTVTNGISTSVGGGGILGGSASATTADSLTVSNSVISNNESAYGTPSDTGQYGGGLQFEGGSLTLSNVTVSGNQSHSSWGSGVDYRAGGYASPESLNISNSTFSNNHADLVASGGNSGGALYASGAGVSLNVTNSKFIGNGVSSTGTEHAAGAAILAGAGNLTVTGSTFTGNSLTSSGSGGVDGGAAVYSTGTATLHYDRITGNTGQAVTAAGAGAINAGDDWWGCNTGPNTTGCDTVGASGVTSLTSYLKLVATASPSHVLGPNGTATITAALTTDSLGASVGGSNLAGAFDTLPVTFGDPPGDATVASSTVALSSGQASVGYNSHTTLGPDNDSVTLDNATVSAAIEVDEAPAITSANTANFNIGTAGSFTVTTTGYPNATLTESGTLPTGLTFADQGNGSAKISGTASGAGGNYPITVTANNGYSPNATQTLTLVVGQPPAFTSGSTATFTIGTAGSFTVTTSGVPTVSTITESGTLPAGVTFADNGNGTATIAGTPTGTGSTYPVTLTATNGVSPNATQNLTIQVNQAPAVTTNPTDQTVSPGNPVTFTAAASGVPTPTVQWQVSTDGGTSFSNIAGATSTSYTFTTSTSDDGHQYRAVFTNVAGTATSTAATAHVGTAPSFTSADNTRFVVGHAGSFTITTTGVPNATLSRSGTGFPAWLTLTDNGDGTGALTGTPPAGSGGSYSFTLKAANGFSPQASQAFTLFVDQSPVITSADHTTFTAGQAGSFAVTTTAGFPTTTALSESGSLPSGVTFHDNGDGTATLAGTPAAGTGGTYPLTITATASGGAAASATQSFTLAVLAPPVITSANHATFSAGTPGSFTVTTTAGNPGATTLTKTGTLPAGVSFTDNGDGTATVAGTPNAGSGGVYTITVTASNGVVPDATQSFTLTVNEPPHITSADHATFARGVADTFTVTTAGGQPGAITLTETGTLPAGVTFTDNGDGTATLGGTATAGGSYPITITASNGVLPNATQNFTLTVNDAPAITSADHTTFTVGTPGTFTVTTTPGTPSSTTLTKTGTLPSGVTFTDNGDGTATIAGTPAAGTGGSYSLTITASNGVLSSTQSFTLTVNQPPAITSADHTTFTVGTAGSFTVTTTPGNPGSTTLTETGSLPSGVTFTDKGDGTATIAGTPAAGTGGSYPITITASNGVLPNPTQSFTLSVTDAPVITSADHTTFAVGSAGSFTVTTTPGTPSSTTLTESGTLPSGVTFHDNSDGTATIAGTPAANTGAAYSLTLTASNGVRSSTQSFTLTVNQLPAITSADHTTFGVGAASSFTVTASPGYPTATSLTETGSLPSGVTFTDHGDNTATLAGTPAAGTGGNYSLTLSAINGAGSVNQTFTLTVTDKPVITSADHTTFAVGSAGTFTVTTTPGTPSSTTLTESGSLPSGVTFHDNSDGTATLAGTPAAGTGNSYPITITASNGVLPNPTQNFTLTVTELPAISSPDHTAFTVGTAGSFSVTTTAGYPAATTLTETGSLPGGVSFTDNGNGTATLAGTPAAGTGGSYPLTLTATNSAGSTHQSFTLTVTDAPVITSADHTTFAVGSAGTFTVTTTPGTPSSTTLTESGSLPSGVSFTDNGNGTATLAGTPAAGTGGSYPLTITASNGARSSNQSFTFTVTELPAITSADHTTLTVGTAGSFSVTSSAGYPAGTTLAESGTLPGGVTFHDNGNGTATLSGTPNSGSGGSYPLTLTATNTAGSTHQAFTLTVAESPVITSADHTTFTAGSTGTFTVATTGGYPKPPAVTETGTLPTGVTFHDNGNGTATLSGKATTGGIYSITITASNGASTPATQHFTLTVLGPPAITSGNAATFNVGSTGTFTVTTRPGVPASPITITESGALPKGVTFHDNRNGTATISGKPTGSVTASYHLTITASNGVAPNATQAFTLTVTHAQSVALPQSQPTSNGSLTGAPVVVRAGQLVTLTGTGYASHAPINIGYYPGAAKLSDSEADSDGRFSVTVRVPMRLGTITLVSTGIGANGQSRFLETRVTVSSTGSVIDSGGDVPSASGGLPYTGAGNIRLASGYGMAAMMAGFGLLVVGRRRRTED